MAKKEDERQERRRFEEKDRKAWSEDDRKKFLDISGKIAPFVRHLTTAPREEKKKDDFETFFSGLFGK